MGYDRDGFLQAVHARLERAWASYGRVDARTVYGPAAEAELRGLLRTCDTRTDMAARHAAGWLCLARAAADPGERGRVHGCMAGTLLYPVWVADAELVPPELAAGYAALAPGTRPDPANADGPHEWAAEAAASSLVLQGRQSELPPELVALLDTLTLSREARIGTAAGLGGLALLATPEYDPWFTGRLRLVSEVAAFAGPMWPFGPVDGEDPVGFVRSVLRRVPAESPERLLVLAGLSCLLLDRHGDAFDDEDLQEAVGMARDVVAQLPRDHSRMPLCLSVLGEALHRLRSAEGATAAECDELVDVCRRAFAGHRRGPVHAGLDLGMALVLRSQHTGRVVDLGEAIAVYRTALGAADSRGETAALRNALSNALRARSVATGSRADLDEALGLVDSSPAPDGTADGSEPPLLAPAMALFNRYLRDPREHGADLDEALRRLRYAESRMARGHPDRPAALDDLGLVLVACFQRTGRPEDLNEAVLVHRESVELTREGNAVLGLRLLNLGGALSVRHQLTEDGDDLREAEACRRRAAELPGLGPAHRASLLSAIGFAVMVGAERAADPAARLDEAVEYMRQGLAMTPEGDPKLLLRRHNLAIALLGRGARTMRFEDAREARALADAVVASLPPDSPELPAALTVAANTRHMTLRNLLSPTVRDETVALYRRAAGATPSGHPARTQRLFNLGNALRGVRSRGSRRRAVLAEASERFREGAREEQCAPGLRLSAARAWGETRAELGDWDGALEGFTLAVDLLHAVAPRHLGRDDQELLLGRAVGLGADAAACAVRCGRPGLAVGLLEQARGVILSHAFDGDSDLTRLREADPALAARFEEVRDALGAATGDLVPLPEEPSVSSGARTDARQRLAAEWRGLTARIRAEHPGLGLLRPVREWDEGEVRAIAAHGPVVLVNVSAYGSHALVVAGAGVGAVPLPELDPGTTAARRAGFERALERLGAPGTSREQSRRAQREVRETLAWLWRAVTGPVLDRLAGADRVWWSPGGVLGTLPLHAAAPGGEGPGALDRVVSSYTPTLRALDHARRRTARPGGTGTLVVGVPEAAGAPPLPGAREEAGRLAGLLPGATLLADASATRSAVVAALHGHAHAHFACHALGDPERASGSRLVLHDHAEHPLTVRELARLRLPSVRLAYLSACDTLRSTPELTDEAVHIVSAFQIAGFPHVVGSLWQVDDVIGAEVARRVYDVLHRGDGTLDVARTAEAVHRAVCALRDLYPLSPSLWACQVHAGP